MSTFRVPKLDDDNKLPAKYVPAPDVIGAATPADLAAGLAGKVNSSTYTAGLAAKQDTATLAADVAGHVSDGSALDTALRAALDAGDHDWTGTHDFTAATVLGLAGDGTDEADGLPLIAVRTNPDKPRASRATAPLSITTPVGGTNEVVHPSIAYEPDGWNGYPYWLAITPYNGGDPRYENPCIYRSLDGTTWAPPTGLTNPIEPAPTPVSDYNSDPELLIVNDVAHLFWREYQSSAGSEVIWLRTSTDGVTWTPKVSVVTSVPTTRSLLSPTVLHHAGTWTMFTVNGVPNPNTLDKWTATDPAGPWTGPTACTMAIPNRDIWHLTVRRWGNELHALVADSALGGNGTAGDLYFGVSRDDGATWTMSATPVLRAAPGAWDGALYRSALIPSVVDGLIGYDLWYGSRSPQWLIGRSRIELSGFTDTVSGPVHGVRDIAYVNKLAAFRGLDPFVLGASFTVPDSTTTLPAADTGQTVTVTAGTFGVSGGKAYLPAAVNSRAHYDSGLADSVVEIDVSGVTTEEFWLVLRLVDATNYLRLGQGSGTNGLVLQQIVAGSASIVGAGAALTPTPTTTDPFTLKVVMNGSALDVYKDGVRLGSRTTTANQTGTKVGIQSANVAARFDNLTVRRLVNGA